MQKWKQKLILISLVVVTLSPAQRLFSQGFDKGNLIFYGMGTGGLGNNSGSIQKAVYNYNFPNYLALNTISSNTSDRVLNYLIYQEITEARTRLSSRGGEVGFEYGLFKYFGIGLAVTNQVITAAHFRTVDTRLITLLALQPINVSTQFSLLSFTDLVQVYLQRTREFYNAGTADLNLFFHLNPNSPFDPYIRIGGGAGSERLYGGNVNRVFGSLGFRYHFNDRFFISSEVEHANTYIVNYKVPSSGYRNRGNYEETAVKFGIGLNFSLSKKDNLVLDEAPKKVMDTATSDVNTKSNENLESKLERFVFFASEIFDLPSSRIHLEGRARLDAIARSLENEYKEYDILVITYTSPYKEDLPGNYENYDLGFERSQAISRVLREKGVNPRRIIDSTQGSALYTVESKEKVVIELRKKVK
ncbi:OmpA family protein [Leptospira jelokensis]|uniref:OmpA-like domain-containing protein n=1 Tax=Leptospira jelokensis TaxID=2484931 RepID=A0A4Z1A4Z0_9LEPT|nr:OmpA family protein [Leptospira jelokensis]TGL69912.1 hypothetical protein EHQ62_07920 [Leptospira jelokensis]TGM06273.1 hypothetical protein EHQ79_01705 [Leptospira jelokensis]